jgi:Ca2+-binding EF-hand superfamily protein
VNPQLTLSDDLFRQLLAKYDADADGLIDYTYLSRMMLPECFPDDAQTVGDAAQLPPEGTAEYFQRMQLLAPYGDATNTPHGPAGTCTPATPAFAAAAAAERGGSEECTPGWARGQEYPRPSAPTVSSQFVALGDIDRLLRDKLMGLSATCGSELRRAFQRFNPNGKGPMSYSQFRQVSHTQAHTLALSSVSNHFLRQNDWIRCDVMEPGKHRATRSLAGPRCDGWCTLCVDVCTLHT